MSDLAGAMSIFDTVLRNRRDDRALTGKSECLRRARQFDEAKELLTDPDLGDMTVLRAAALSQVLCEQYEYVKARKILEGRRGTTAKEEEEEQEQVNVSLALVEMSAKPVSGDNYKKAQKILEELLDQIPKSTRGKYLLAWCLAAQCEAGGTQPKPNGHMLERLRCRAEQLCNEISEGDPDFGGPYSCKARIAWQRNRRLEAESLLRSAAELAPFGGYQTRLANLYLDDKRYDDAEVALGEALKHNPQDEYAYLYRARLMSETNRAEDAIRALRRAREINPEEPRTVSQLAVALVNAGDYAAAEQVVRKALKEIDKPGQKYLATTFAWVLVKRTESSDQHRRLHDAVYDIQDLVERVEPDPPDRSMLHYYQGVTRLRLATVMDAFQRPRILMQAQHDFRKFSNDYKHSSDNYYKAQHEDEYHYAQSYLDETKGIIPIIGRPDISGRGLFAVVVIMLGALWIAFFLHDGVDRPMLQVLTPSLMALGLVALLLPVLTSFKVGPVEAQVGQPIDSGITSEPPEIRPFSPVVTGNPIWECIRGDRKLEPLLIKHSVCGDVLQGRDTMHDPGEFDVCA